MEKYVKFRKFELVTDLSLNPSSPFRYQCWWVPQIPFAFQYAPLKGRVYASTNGNAPSFDKHGTRLLLN